MCLLRVLRLCSVKRGGRAQGENTVISVARTRCMEAPNSLYPSYAIFPSCTSAAAGDLDSWSVGARPIPSEGFLRTMTPSPRGSRPWRHHHTAWTSRFASTDFRGVEREHSRMSLHEPIQFGRANVGESTIHLVPIECPERS